jgi:hypothetical protein
MIPHFDLYVLQHTALVVNVNSSITTDGFGSSIARTPSNQNAVIFSQGSKCQKDSSAIQTTGSKYHNTCSLYGRAELATGKQCTGAKVKYYVFFLSKIQQKIVNEACTYFYRPNAEEMQQFSATE